MQLRSPSNCNTTWAPRYHQAKKHTADKTAIERRGESENREVRSEVHGSCMHRKLKAVRQSSVYFSGWGYWWLVHAYRHASDGQDTVIVYENDRKQCLCSLWLCLSVCMSVSPTSPSCLSLCLCLSLFFFLLLLCCPWLLRPKLTN